MTNLKQTPAVQAAGEALPGNARPTDRLYDYKLLIDVVASMFNISTYELRMYEILGLIRRERAGDDWTYCWSHCERVALIVRGREAGLRLRDLKPLILAMDETASLDDLNRGKTQALSMIRRVLADNAANDRALDELFRVDWELSDRLSMASGAASVTAAKNAEDGAS